MVGKLSEYSMFFKRERNTVPILQYLIVATMEYWISYLSIPHERQRTLPLPGTRGYATRPGNESIQYNVSREQAS